MLDFSVKLFVGEVLTGCGGGIPSGSLLPVALILCMRRFHLALCTAFAYVERAVLLGLPDKLEFINFPSTLDKE